MTLSLITTDIHLTEKKEDQYRFGLFPWIRETFEDDLRTVYILGDITDRKNYHADWFVNKVVESLRQLSLFYKVIILRGNHDYDTSPDHPFFNFLGRLPWIDYITEPTYTKDKVLYLPHTRDPGNDWGIMRQVRKPRAIFLHQTFRGAVAESGYALSGMSSLPFHQYDCPIYSGDIHVPQQLGPITYVGSPYHTRFGDQFEPRCLVIDKDYQFKGEVQFPAPRKWAIDIQSADQLEDLEYLGEGDMVKIKIFMARSQFHLWPQERDKARAIARGFDLKVHSVTLKEREKPRERAKRVLRPLKGRSRKDVYTAFCGRYEVREDLIEAGQEFME